MLIESGEIQHYCCVKRVSALLFDSKMNNKTYHCMLHLTRFTTRKVLENHEKYCNGVNGRPTRIEMPEGGKNKITFQSCHKQMKVPYVIYADFEAILHKIQGCERGPESKSYTEKIKKHEACGYAYKVVKSDGEVMSPRLYTGKKPVSNFLENILTEEVEIRKNLAVPKPMKMAQGDWEKFKTAADCHICGKCLVQEEFLDSLPVWQLDDYRYCGQSHKTCYYENKKTGLYEIKLKRVEEQADKEKAKKLRKCLFGRGPLLQKNYRDAVKDHCHIAG